MFLASQQGHVHSVRLLLAAGAKPEIPEQAHGLTAVDVADHEVLQLFSAAPPTSLPATFTHRTSDATQKSAQFPSPRGSDASRFRPPPPMSCPSVSVFRNGAVGIRWDEPAITYAALLGGAGGGQPTLDKAQLRQVQQGLALPVTTYTIQVVMCIEDGGRVLPEQALQAAQDAQERGSSAPPLGLGAGALRQLSGRRSAQFTQMSTISGHKVDEPGTVVTSLAMLPGDEGHITLQGTVICTQQVPAAGHTKLTLSDTLLLGGVYRVRAAAANALGDGAWSPLTPPIVVAKPPSQCPTPAALVLGISPPIPAAEHDFEPGESLSEAWSQDSHLQVGTVVPVHPDSPLAPLQGEMACLQLHHRQDGDLNSPATPLNTDHEPALDATGSITVRAGSTHVTACLVVHWLAALGMSAEQVCPSALYAQGAYTSAQQHCEADMGAADEPQTKEEGRGFLDGGSPVQSWELCVWANAAPKPRSKSVFKRLAASQRSGSDATPRQLVVRQRLHGELFFAALLGCRAGWTYTVQVSAINRCGPGPTSRALRVQIPRTLHPLPPAHCMPNAGGDEGGSPGAQRDEAKDAQPAAPVEVPLDSGYNTPAMQSSHLESEGGGSAPLPKAEGPSAGSAFSGRPVAEVLAEDFGSTWGGEDTATSDMVLPAGGVGGRHPAGPAPVLSPTDSDAPRQTAVQGYNLGAASETADGSALQEGGGEGSGMHWLDAYSGQEQEVRSADHGSPAAARSNTAGSSEDADFF